LNGNLRNLIFYGKSGCITPEQKKSKKIICPHIYLLLNAKQMRDIHKILNFSGFRSIIGLGAMKGRPSLISDCVIFVCSGICPK
jgi:hypothetical protein